MSYYVLRYGSRRGDGYYLGSTGWFAKDIANQYRYREGAEQAAREVLAKTNGACTTRIVRVITAQDRREEIARLRAALNLWESCFICNDVLIIDRHSVPRCEHCSTERDDGTDAGDEWIERLRALSAEPSKGGTK